MKYLQNVCFLCLLFNFCIIFLVPAYSSAEDNPKEIIPDVHINANISSPKEGTYCVGQLLVFNTMYLGKYPYNNFNWKSNISGDFGNLASFSKALPVGKHTVALTVTDTRDNSKSQATVEINIVDCNVKIAATDVLTNKGLAPGQTIAVGKTILFSVSDWGKSEQITQNPNSPLKYNWSSNLSGDLGNYSSFGTNQLTIGKHKITLTVTLPGGKTSQDSMDIEVVPADFTVNLDSPNPKDGTYIMSKPILFSANAFGGKPPYVFEWSSDLQGILTKSQSLSYSDNSLKVGKHNITLTVTNANGAKKTLHTEVEVVKKLPQSTKPYPCVALKVSGDPNKKIDFVVAADKTSNLTSAEIAQDGKEIMDNILSKEPFKSNANKFNFYYINKLVETAAINANVCTSKPCNKPAATTEDILSNYCPLDFYAVVVPDNGMHNTNGSITLEKSLIDAALHEFGHSFGNLRDEYLMDHGSSDPNPGGSSNDVVMGAVNCDVEATCMKWKDIPGTGCYKGCYDNGHYRPADKSIMQGGETAMNEAAGFVSFDPVSEKRLRAVLALWDESGAAVAVTTNLAACQMLGNSQPCKKVSFAEVKNAIVQFFTGKMLFDNVKQLVNSWLWPVKHSAN